MFNDQPIFEFRGPFGIPIQIGGSIIFLAFIFMYPFGGAEQMLWNGIFLGLIILSIFLHEMGHAWATLVQGHDVKRIMIYGGGGFCERFRAVPLRDEEFIVAMGPLVNLAIWAGASLLNEHVVEGRYASHILYLLAQINIFLFALNLVPVQPLDGGKLLFLALRRFFDRSPATKIAGFIGLVFAVLWIPAMLLCYIYLGFLLLFLPSIALHWHMFQGRAG